MSFAYDSAFTSVPERRTAISSSIQRLAMHFKGYFRVRRNSVFAMTQDLIRYDILAQEALRGVIKTVLDRAVIDGLPGEHHFYISFATHAPGVKISQRLKETYPEEMTIVLQHQFWDLEVKEQHFSVGLSFNGIPEKLHVPFSAVKRFFDPHVQFGLEFEVAPVTQTNTPEGETNVSSIPAVPASLSDMPEVGDQPEADAESINSAEANAENAKDDDSASGDQSADVVSLDAFRKNK